jgi:hypothetical protein
MFTFDFHFCNSVWLSLGGINTPSRAILSIGAPDGAPAASFFSAMFYVYIYQ